ncbi:MAG: ATP-binding protein [Candidatus Methanomethylophilaceae archaeon]
MEISSLIKKYTDQVLNCQEKGKFEPSVFSSAIYFVINLIEEVQNSEYSSNIHLSPIFEHFFSNKDILFLYNEVNPEDRKAKSYEDIDFTCKCFIDIFFVVFTKVLLGIPNNIQLNLTEKVYLFKGMAKHNHFGFSRYGYSVGKKSNRICRITCGLIFYESERICEFLVDKGLLLNNPTFDFNPKSDKEFKVFCSTGKLHPLCDYDNKTYYYVYPPEPEPETEQEEEQKASVVNPNRNNGFSLEGLNTSEDLKMIVNAVKKFKEAKDKDPDAPRMNILLTGNPGTGKTEFVKYVGRETGKEVDVIMGSDVLGKYVGETEASIKGAFDKAKKEDHIIFLD